MTFTVERISSELPFLKMPRTVTSEIGRIAEGNILDNIRTQRQASGAALKTNAPSTLERKRRLGRPQLSLIDRLKRFIQGNRKSWRYRTVRANVEQPFIEIRPATAELRRLVRFVQEKGYTGWFALSDRGRGAIAELIGKWIRKELQKASRKKKRRKSSRNRR